MPSPENKPLLFSVVVPVAPDKPAPAVLKSLRNAAYPTQKLEVLVVEGKNVPRQRNAGVQAATGDVVCFFDDDVAVAENHFARLDRVYREWKADAVGGPNLSPPDSSFLQRCIGCVQASVFGFGAMANRYRPQGRIRLSSEQELMTCNLSFKRDVLKRFPFDERVYPNDENLLLERLAEAGHKLVYDPELVVWHPRKDTFLGFARQVFGYGKGRARHLRLRPASLKAVHLIPAAFLLYLLVLFFLGSHPLAFHPLLAYIALLAGFSVFHGLRNGLPTVPMYLALFPLVHASYGLGFLFGILVPTPKPLDTRVSVRRETP